MISEVKKLSESDLNECTESFKESSLNQAYDGQVLDWIKTGLQRNELWGAETSSGEIVAIMWIEENGFFSRISIPCVNLC